MKLGIAASIAVISVSMGSSAYAQSATPAELNAAIQQAVPVKRLDDGRGIATAHRLNWSGARPTLQGDRMPAGRVALAKAPSRVIGSAKSVDLDFAPASSDISGALRRGR